jgi:hypothetical protein
MAYINRKDSNGVKSLLAEGELGLDTTGSDDGRIGVGTATGNVLLAKKDEIDALATEKQSILAEGAFVDGDKTKLDGTEITSQLDARDTANRSTDNHTDGTTNGVYTLTERTKLAGIETGATADQTGAEIKAAYEAEANTNAYTDAERTLVDVSTGLDTTATTLPAAVNELHGQVTALENRELTHKVDGTVAPTVTDDADAGFEVGSLWINTVADEAYRCADATAGAAVWVNTTLTADELSALLISYDNTVSGLAANTLQGAVDEVSLDLDTTVKANLVSSGVINKQDGSLVFSTAVGNEYKTAIPDKFVNFDGKVVGAYGPELITNGDFSDGTIDNILLETEGVIKFYDDGKLRLTGSGWVKLSFPTKENTTYRLTFNKETITPSDCLLSIGNGVTSYDNTYLSAKVINSLTRISEVFTTVSGSTNTEIFLYVNVAGSSYFDNISVREIKTIDMTDNMPEVTVQDQATNGLVVQSSVNAGDYVVVDKEELVTNGTFDTDINGWTLLADSAVVDVNGVTITSATTDTFLKQVINVVPLTKYIISFDGSATDTNFSSVWVGSSTNTFDNTRVYIGTATQKRFHAEFTTLAGQSDVYFAIHNGIGGTSTTVDNISVKLKSDIYRAKQDFPIDYDPATTPISVLDTDYFEDRTQFGITNKILATMKEDGTIKTEVCFVDTDIEHCGNAHIVMTDNGYSKLSNGLYSKGSDVVTPIGTWSTLNKGAFHPVYNYFGARRWNRSFSGIDGDNWYSSSVITPSNTADAFNIVSDSANSIDSGAVDITGYIGSGVSGHPDSKFYDIIYSDQWIDLRIEANAISEQDELNRVGTKAKSGQLDGIGGVVSTYASYQSDGSAGTYTLYADTYNYVVGEKIDIVFYPSLTVKKGAIITAIPTSFYMDIDTLFERVAGDTAYITKTLPHPSSGTALRTDWIGDPANYPQDWKDRLASGLPMIGMNPLLVGQDGTDYTSGTSACVLSSKIIERLLVLEDTSGNYSPWSIGLEYVSNTVTSTIDRATNTQIIYYTAKIPTTQVTDPKAVKLVGNYVTATNSHSIYKGNQLVPTGKVNVGNGDNGLENRVVENVDVGVADYDSKSVIGSNVFTGCIVYCDDTNNGISTGIIGRYYKRIGSSFTWVMPLDLLNTSSFEDLGTIPLSSTPTHSTISLDNSNSPVVKFIETIAEDDDGMAHYQLFAQEMVWDYDADTGLEISTIDGTIAQAVSVGEIRRVTNGIFKGLVIECLIAINNTLDTEFLLVDGGLSYIGSSNLYFKIWDGNGFGDDNQFTQLTNGTLTDDNANTVKTICASIPLNKYIGDK